MLANLLASNGFVMYNKAIARQFGIYPAIMLGELCSECSHWEQQGALEDGWFYSTRQNIEDNTGLSRKQQETAITELVEGGIIEKCVRGVPAQRYFRINESAVLEVLGANKFVPKEQASLSQMDKLDCPKGTGNNNNIIINNKNKREGEGKALSSPKAPRFVKPTLEEVEAYIQEKGYGVNPEAFIGYYDSNGWKVGRQAMKDWKGAVRTWEFRHKPPKPKEKSWTKEDDEWVEDFLKKPNL